MKTKLLISSLIIPIMSYSQSLSITKVIGYASESDINFITTELSQKGFSVKKSVVEGYPMYSYKKSSGETLSIGRNEELRMVIYKPSYEVYQTFKTKVLTPEFHFSYSYKNNNYYESTFMRIGVNDTNGIISFFKPIK